MEFGVGLSETQYKDIWLVLNQFRLYSKTLKYRRYKSQITSRTAKELWKFAIDSVLLDVREKLTPTTYQFLEQRRKLRLEYIRLYKMNKLHEIIPQDSVRLEDLQRFFSVSDLLFFHRVANQELRNELKEKRFQQEEIEKQNGATDVARTADPKRATWGSWLKSFATTGPSPTASAFEDKKLWDDSDLDRLVDYDEKFALHEAALPSDCVLYRVQWRLQRGSLFLKSAGAGDSISYDCDGVVPSAFSIIGEDMSAQIVSCLDSSLSLLLATGKVSAYDGLSSFGKQVITSSYKDTSRPLFALQFKSKDTTSVQVDSQSLIVLYSPYTIEAISQFIKVPDLVSDAFLQVTSSLKHQTRAGLEYALEQHKATSITVNMDAPIFLIPLSEHEVLAVDSGNLAVGSVLVDSKEKALFQEKQGDQLNAPELEHLLSLMYDKYDVQLTNMKMLVAGSSEECLRLLEGESGPATILDDLDLKLTLESSILPKAVNLSKTKVSGSLPRLHFNISDRKYKAVMKAISLILGVTVREQLSSEAESKQEEIAVGTSPKEEKIPELTDSRGAVTQSLIDFSFQVEEVKVKLLLFDRSMECEKELALLCLRMFDLKFTQRAMDRAVFIKLHGLFVKDLEQNNPMFQNLIESVEEGQELVLINFQQFEHTSPQFTGYDQILNVSFDALNVLVTRRSILNIYDFLMATFAGDEIQKGIATPSTSAKPTVAIPTTKTRITANMRKIALQLNDSGQVFASSSLGQSNLSVTLDGPSLSVIGSLGVVEVISGNERVAFIEGERSAAFTYLVDHPDVNSEFDSMLKFTSESTHLFYRPIVINRILEFFSEFAAMRTVLDEASRRTREATPATSKFGFKIQVKSPLIEHKTSSGERLLVYLGQLDARNYFERKESSQYVIDATLSDMRILSVLPDFGEQNLVDDVQLRLQMKGSHINVELREVELKMTKEQYEFLFQTYEFLFTDQTPSSPVVNGAHVDKVGGNTKDGEAPTSGDLHIHDEAQVLLEVSLVWDHIHLELLLGTESLTKLDLHGLFFKMISYKENISIGEFGLTRFSIKDSRPNRQIYKDIIALPPALKQPFAYQLLCQIKIDENGTKLKATLDSPQILAIFDYLKQLQLFFLIAEGNSSVKKEAAAWKGKTAINANGTKPLQIKTSAPNANQDAPFTLSISVIAVNAQIAFVHDSFDVQSNAIVFGLKHIAFQLSDLFSAQMQGLGIFLCRMDNRSNKVRILQDVNLNISPKTQRKDISEYVAVEVQKVLLRLSYQEAMFMKVIVMQYLNYFLYSSSDTVSVNEVDFEKVASATSVSSQSSEASNQIVSITQSLDFRCHGFRLILIDDLNDLHVPMFDFSIASFNVGIKNWSSAVRFPFYFAFFTAGQPLNHT
jgi:vacuolar protein sorting-associated protein 13A/C